jgi:hypothetical protein
MAGSLNRYPIWRNTTPVAIDADTLQRAEQLISSCESCTPDLAEIPFDYVLDTITGCDPEFTDYVLTAPAQCPKCACAIQTGYWRWYDSEHKGRKVFILPGTLVALKVSAPDHQETLSKAASNRRIED